MIEMPNTKLEAVPELALLTEVFEEAPAFIALLSGKDHTIELANPAYYQLVGHRDIIGKPLLVAMPELVGQGFLELLDDVFQTGAAFIGKGMQVHLQVTPNSPLMERYVDFVYQARKNKNGTIIGILAHGVDVTDLILARHESEQRSQQIKQQLYTFDTALTNITDFVYIFDKDGRFIYSNKSLLDLLGMSLEQVVGKNFHELPYPVDLATTLQTQIAQVVETGEQIHDETLYISPSGKVGYYEYIFSPVFGTDGQIASIAGSTRDITERVRQDRQKDEFLSIVSHELKTPVTSIKAYTQVLRKRLAKEGNTGAVAHLSKIDAQLNKLITLIGDLLDLTKIDSGRLQFHEANVVFDEVVAEVIEEVQRTTEQHKIIQKGSTNRTLLGDRDRIGQVLTNFLTNAIKYSLQADIILVRLTANSDSITLSVQDYGMGISAEHLPYVFERFYRASEELYETVPGLGLGLYISSEIIQRHKGTIRVESEKGQGSTFSFTLPAHVNTRKHSSKTGHS